jgi:hypothetical protein
MYCFIYLLCMACCLSLSLGVVDFENIQELEDQDFEQQIA